MSATSIPDGSGQAASGTAESPPVPRRWLILGVVGLAQLMVVLDATIVNIALPSAQRSLHFSTVDRQWVGTACALTFGSLLLFGGRLADLLGRKVTFLAGLIGFAAASAGGGAATSFGMLVAARVCQGALGALLAPAALSLLTTTFTDPKERSRAFGVFGAIAGGGGAIGLLLGGLLTEYLSWRWCLYVNLVFAAISGVGAVLVLERQRARRDPLLAFRDVLDRNRGGPYLSILIAGSGIFGIFLFLTYYLQLTLHYSPVVTGVAFLPMIGCIMVSANLPTIALMPRLGPRPLVTSGMLLAAA